MSASVEADHGHGRATREKSAASWRDQAADIDFLKLAFVAAAAAVAGVHSVLLYLGFTKTSVEVDEGLFLEVVRNAVNGDGYTGDGVYDGTGLVPFATEITTGPTLLVPASALHALGLDPLMAGRLVALLFYAALLVALWKIGHRIGGRWAALAATLGPVMLNAFTFDQSPLYAPQMVLGELPAAAMIAWAIVSARRRSGLAGVFVGFAFLAKVISAFMVPAVLLVLVLAHLGAPRRALWLELTRFVSAALVPIVAFEMVKLVTLGPGAYFELVPTYWQKTQASRLPTFMVDEKSAALWKSWFLPAPVTALLFALALVLLTSVGALRLQRWRASNTRLSEIARNDRFVLAVSGLTAGAGITAGWFALKATDPLWLRHPTPGLVIAAGVSAAILVAIGRDLAGSGGPGRRVGVAAIVMTSLVLAVVSVRHVDASLGEPRFGYLGDQEGLAEIIVESGTQEVQGLWGPMVPLALLADKRAHSIAYEANPDDLLVLDVYPRGQLAELGIQLADALCKDVIYHGDVIMCWPRADIVDVLAPISIETEAPTGTGA